METKGKVLVLLGEGFEEIEAITPVDLLRRAGLQVSTASVDANLRVTGSHGITVMADRFLPVFEDEDFDLLLVPGGPGVKDLRSQARIIELLQKQIASGRKVAAICAGPLVLADAGLLAEREVTSFPGHEAEVRAEAREYSQRRVVFDGPVCTSRGAGTAEEFSLALIAWLAGAEASETVRRNIVART